MMSTTSQRRPVPRPRRTRQPVAWKILTAAVIALVLYSQPRLAEMVLAGIGVTLAVGLAVGLVYLAGLARGTWKPPARIRAGRFTVEFL
jgi:hypothetical protein